MKAPLYANYRCPGCGCVMNRALLRVEETGHYDEWTSCLTAGCEHYKVRWEIPTVELVPFKERASA